MPLLRCLLSTLEEGEEEVWEEDGGPAPSSSSSGRATYGRPNPAQQGCFELDLDWLTSEKFVGALAVAAAAAVLAFFINRLTGRRRRRRRSEGVSWMEEDGEQRLPDFWLG